MLYVEYDVNDALLALRMKGNIANNVTLQRHEPLFSMSKT